MTIRVLHMGSPDGLYGAERWILALVRYLDGNIIESHVGVIRDAPSIDPPLLREAGKNGLATVSIDAPGRFNWAAVRGLRDYIRRNRIDVLHTHFYKTDLIGLAAVRNTSCKIVTTPHGWSTQAGFVLRLYEALDRQVFRYFDAVVPLSPELLNEIKGRAGSGLRYIQNGVDIGEIDSTVELAMEANLWKEDGTFVIGYIGQLIHRKGIDTLIRAFAKLSIPNSRLVLVGEGPQRSELESLAQSFNLGSRVNFLGYRKDRLALLRGFDIFVLPSLLEGIPRCLMESMAARIPIVSSDIPGSRELVDDGVTGLLFTPGNVASLQGSLEKLQNTSCRLSFAEAAREKVTREFSAAAMADSYTQLYDDLYAQTLSSRNSH